MLELLTFLKNLINFVLKLLRDAFKLMANKEQHLVCVVVPLVKSFDYWFTTGCLLSGKAPPPTALYFNLVYNRVIKYYTDILIFYPAGRCVICVRGVDVRSSTA